VLQDAGLPLAKLCGAYQQLVCIVRKLYQECRLVHADLSEYNILVHKVSIEEYVVPSVVDIRLWGLCPPNLGGGLLLVHKASMGGYVVPPVVDIRQGSVFR
jgi:hypothetical protein